MGTFASQENQLMRDLVQIKYGITLFIAAEDLKEEEAERNDEEESEGVLFTTELADFWSARIEKENQQEFTYTVGPSGIKYERALYQMPNEYIRLLPDSAVMQHFYTNSKGEPHLTESQLHHNPSASDWQVHTTVETVPTATKDILGYTCHQLLITQTRINEKEGWTIVDHYELFVTGQLYLPARLVIPLWEPVTDLCALEIKSIRPDKPNSYSLQRAVAIQRGIDPQAIELPALYR